MTNYEKLHALITEAEENGMGVNLTIHEAPTTLALTWLQSGLLDAVEQGCVGNPPTGRMGSDKDDVHVTAVVFTDGPRRPRS